MTIPERIMEEARKAYADMPVKIGGHVGSGSLASIAVIARAILAAEERGAASSQQAEPGAWIWEQLMHDSMGGWEKKCEPHKPPSWIKPEYIKNLTPLYASPSPAPSRLVEGPQPCGIADPSTRDCPNMKEVGGGMDGERYRCAVCGNGYFLDYEEMK